MFSDTLIPPHCFIGSRASTALTLWTWLCAHPQVQPDLDELEVNMEDNEDAESTKSEVKLGKLQFSMDYDFQKGEVRDSALRDAERMQNVFFSWNRSVFLFPICHRTPE